MSKKLLILYVRVSEDMKTKVEKELQRRRKKRPWEKPTIASFFREITWFYFQHQDCPKTSEETKEP